MPAPLPRRIPLLAVILASVLLTIPFHLRPENFIVDDGYFYPEIARFIARGAGSTFNGIMSTNGYHPLWMLFCVLAARVTTNSAVLVQMLSTVQDFLVVGSIAFTVYIARAARLQGSLFAALPLLFFGMVLGIWRLLESSLALALQLAVLVLVLPVLPELQKRIGLWRTPLIGALLGLVLLARLDLIFFVLVVIFYELFRRDMDLTRRRRLKLGLLEAGTVALLLAPYLAWNWTRFHHLLPISGAIKSTFPHLQHWGLSPFMYPVVAAMVINALLLLKRVRSPFDTLCLLCTAAAALHMAYTLSFGEMAAWYMTTGYLGVSLCLVWVSDAVLKKAPGLVWIEPVLACFFFAAFLLLAALRDVSNFTYTHLRTGRVSFHGQYLEAKRGLAIKLDQTLPAGSRIFVFDAPGGVAFYSKMSILPSDGLVADYAYNQDIVRESFACYAAVKHVDYLLAPYLRQGQTYDRLSLQGQGMKGGQSMQVRAPLTRLDAGSLELTDADVILRFRQINPDLEALYPEVAVWRLRHPTRCS